MKLKERQTKRKTVGELIEGLKRFPLDMPAIVRGYEGGYHDVGSFTEVEIMLDVNDESWYGPHEEYEAWKQQAEGGPERVQARRICA